jgi:hypothetical protein
MTSDVALEKPLKGKKLAFVNHYFGAARGIATEAARLAGYRHPRVIGPRLVRHDPAVRAVIAAGIREFCMRPERALCLLTDIAEADIADYIGPDGEITLESIRASGKSSLVRDLVPTQSGLTVKMHSKTEALATICKFHRLVTEEHNHFHLPPNLGLYSDAQIAMMKRGEDPGPPALANGGPAADLHADNRPADRPALDGPVIDVTPAGPEPEV